jgi:hypothetical protein
MLNKILILLIIILAIESIKSLNSADLCSSSACNKEYSYQCTKTICSLNKETCIDYYKFKMSYGTRSYQDLISFQTCESKKLSENDYYCLKNTNCFQKTNLKQIKYIKDTSLFKTFNKKIKCDCDGKYSFKCGDYCTINNKYCDQLNLRIKYQKKTNKKDVKKCPSFSQKIAIV